MLMLSEKSCSPFNDDDELQDYIRKNLRDIKINKKYPNINIYLDTLNWLVIKLSKSAIPVSYRSNDSTNIIIPLSFQYISFLDMMAHWEYIALQNNYYQKCRDLFNKNISDGWKQLRCEIDKEFVKIRGAEELIAYQYIKLNIANSLKNKQYLLERIGYLIKLMSKRS